MRQKKCRGSQWIPQESWDSLRAGEVERLMPGNVASHELVGSYGATRKLVFVNAEVNSVFHLSFSTQ